MIFCWVAPILLFLIENNGNINEGLIKLKMKDIELIILCYACIVGLTFWLFSVKLIYENSLLTYKSFFFVKSVDIRNITEINTEFYRSRYIVILTQNEENRKIKFYETIFRKKDLVKLLKKILEINTAINLDNFVSKLIKE